MAKKRGRFNARTTSIFAFWSSNPTGATEIELAPTPGDISVSGWNADFVEHIKVFDRLRKDGFTLGQDQTVDIGMTILMPRDKFTDNDRKIVQDFFERTGAFAGAVSFDDDIPMWGMKIVCSNNIVGGELLLSEVEGGIGFSAGDDGNTMALSATGHTKPAWS